MQGFGRIGELRSVLRRRRAEQDRQDREEDDQGGDPDDDQDFFAPGSARKTAGREPDLGDRIDRQIRQDQLHGAGVVEIDPVSQLFGSAIGADGDGAQRIHVGIKARPVGVGYVGIDHQVLAVLE